MAGQSPDGPSEVRARPSLWRTGLRAGAVAALLNAGLFVVAVIAGVFPRLHPVPFSGNGFGLGSVVVLSVAAALVGTACYGAIGPRAERPMHAFTLLVACVLLVSFAAPMFAPDWTPLRLGVIEVTHLVVAGVTVLAIWRRTRTESHYPDSRG